MYTHQICLLLAAAAVEACAGGTQQPSPGAPAPVPEVPSAQITPSTVLPGRQTVGLAPTTIIQGLADPEPVRMLFDSLIAERLRLAGYVVVPVPDWKAAFDSQAVEHGIYDPAAGTPDSAKMAIASEHAMQALQEKYHVAMWLVPSVVMAAAQVNGWTAAWDGTSQGIASFWDKAALKDFWGTLPAFSLCVVIGDSSGNTVYHRHGGIEVASRPNKPLPREKLFKDKGRSEGAVGRALQPFLDEARKAAPAT